jgi:hypothetical protein
MAAETSYFMTQCPIATAHNYIFLLFTVIYEKDVGFSWLIARFSVEKGPTGDATDAPQPYCATL